MPYRKVFKIWVFIVLAVMFGAVCRASCAQTVREENPEFLFKQGNGYYEKAEYDRAIEEYEKILAAGNESAPLYYNLAGAYFKAGKLGKAILNYERAKRITPRDADLTANYRFARARVKGKLIPEGGLWAWRPLRIYCGNFSINEFTRMTSWIYILVIILLCAAVIRPNRGIYHVAGIFLLIVFILFNLLVICHKADFEKKSGVITASRTEALFGPFDSATKFFTLHEGMEIAILAAKNGWYKVRRSDGKVGWIPKGDVERVYVREGNCEL